jgi:hypothetical protein
MTLKPMYQTTIVILSDFIPGETRLSAEELCRNAMNGDSYMFSTETVAIDSDTLEGEGLREFFSLDDEE